MCGRKKVFAAETIEKVPEVVVKVWYNVNVISTSQIHNIPFFCFFFIYLLNSSFVFNAFTIFSQGLHMDQNPNHK